MEEEELINTFIAVTGATEEQALLYLTQTHFDFETAEQLFLADTSRAVAAVPTPSPSTSSYELTNTTTAASPAVQLNQLAGDGFASHFPEVSTPPPDAPFASGDCERLTQMYTTPAYVHRSDSSFRRVCETAAQQNRWVLVAVRDGSFQSHCLPRSVWGTEAMRSLTSGSIECYEIDVRVAVGRTLAESYRLDLQQLPCMFLVDPTTGFKIKELPLLVDEDGDLDGAVLMEALLMFIVNNGSPQSMMGGPEAEVGPSDAGVSALHSQTMGEPAAIIDVDAEDAVEALEEVAAGEDEEAPLPVTPVHMDEYFLPDGCTSPLPFRLRCRLPHTILTISLRPETPVGQLIAYLAYEVHLGNPQRYPTAPSVAIRCGFPPKTVSDGVVEGQMVCDWPGVRTGDVLTIHLDS